MDGLKKAKKEIDALKKAKEKSKQKKGHKILKAQKKENALKKAEEKTKQKEGHKIFKQDALIKAQEKRIAASIKAQQKNNQQIHLRD